eukprot:3792717-Amphidinium_carterae.1
MLVLKLTRAVNPRQLERKTTCERRDEITAFHAPAMPSMCEKSKSCPCKSPMTVTFGQKAQNAGSITCTRTQTHMTLAAHMTALTPSCLQALEFYQGSSL